MIALLKSLFRVANVFALVFRKSADGFGDSALIMVDYLSTEAKAEAYRLHKSLDKDTVDAAKAASGLAKKLMEDN